MKTSSNAHSPSPGEPVAVIVADGSPAILDSIRRLLEAVPRIQLVGTAPDGREAVEIVARLCPRLALLEFHMPRMNGTLAARVIRRQFPATRIILMSAHRLSDADQISRQFGADAFIEKGSLGHELPGLVAAWFA